MGEVLGREDLLQLLAEDAPLVEYMVDAAAQVQPNGIELTLRSVGRLTEAGAVGVLDHERQVAAAASLEFDAQGWLHLEPGCYRIVYNEVIHMPADMVALARPRSSLVRNGVTVETGLWDSAYHGRSESLLIVFNPFGCSIKQNTRMIQLVFFKLSKPVEPGLRRQISRRESLVVEHEGRQRLYRVAAIVIRRRDMGEADRLLTALAREREARLCWPKVCGARPVAKQAISSRSPMSIFWWRVAVAWIS